jgi:hypothetical protein
MAIDAGIALLSLGIPILAAYGAIQVYEMPREAEKRQNAKYRAAVKRVNVETAGLRNTLEGLEMRLRDTRAAIAGIDDNLRLKLQKMPARDQAALDALIGQGTFAGVLNMLRNGVLVDRRLASLAKAWSRGASERQCTQALCENLWILEPNLVSEGHIFVSKTLGTVAESYFGARMPANELTAAAAKKKPSAVGMFRRRSAVASPADPGIETLVVIEARKPGEPIGQATVSAATNYVHAIRRLAPELADWPIECHVIGGAIADDAHHLASHNPPGIQIHLSTWEGLMNLARARRPETVELRAMRFDADHPPSYHINAQPTELSALLGMDEEAERIADSLRA